MMRNKDKSQGEEGSVHSNASRYDLSTFFFFFFLQNLWIPCLLWQPWVTVSV